MSKPTDNLISLEEPELGEFLCKTHARWFFLVIIAVIAAVAIVCIPLFPPEKKQTVFTMITSLYVTVSIATAAIIFLPDQLAVYTNGFQSRGIFRTRSFLYSQVDSYKYIRNIVHISAINGVRGIPITTGFNLDIYVILPNGRKKKVSFTRIGSFKNVESDTIAELLNETIFIRMKEQFKQTGEFVWTKSVKLTKDGVILTPKKLLGGFKESQFIPYEELEYNDEYSNTVSREDSGMGFKLGEKSWVCVPNKTPNFLPAVRLFYELYAAKVDDETPNHNQPQA